MIKKLLHPVVVKIKTCVDDSKHRNYLCTDNPGKLKKYRGSRAGKRCFIIGNGPSLKVEDLTALKDEDCFACNRIYGLYDKTEWRPKYYCSQDCKVIEQIAEDLPYAVEECEAAFFPYNFRGLFPEQVLKSSKVGLFYKPYVSVYSEDGTYPEGIMPFSDDISKAVYDGLSITYGMIQMAVYMGYKEIYLIGIDHNYPMKNGVVDVTQSYAEGIKPIDMSTQYPPELLLCENSFRGERKYCEANGVKIYNATRGGKLEVFERIELDQLIKE